MARWMIEDETIVKALHENGFTCEKPKSELIPGAIHFITRSLEEKKAAEDASRWYDTNCPIAWNEAYRLPDGRLLQTSGTRLHWG